MNRKEILEFLELPESATDHDISVRMNDKLVYFQRLSENAPNDFLRKLHISNTEKIRHLQAEMFGTGKANQAHPAYQQAESQRQADRNYNAPPPASNKTEAAWLIRHTENQSAKTFSLYYGKNYIGRSVQANFPTIVIDDDPYVSRVHALLEVINLNPLQVVISDDPSTNGGKASKNGTYINGDERRLNRKVVLGANDTIQVGMTKLIIRLNNTSLQKIVQEVEESGYMKTVVIDIF